MSVTAQAKMDQCVFMETLLEDCSTLFSQRLDCAG